MSTLKRAYLKLEELQARLREAENAKNAPIAVVGLGCRFPGRVNDAAAFWRLLSGGMDAVTEVPADRWNIDDYYDPDPETPGMMSTRWGAFVEGIDQFDPQLFGISPREAISMDPQQRLLLEVCWEALENAGHAPDSLSGSATGIFAGIIGEEYGLIQTENGGINHIDTYYGSGVSASIASGRLAYVFGFQGPAISINTSCSSSLVGVHLACQSLRSRECDMALAGGVSLMLRPDATIALTKHMLMASDGRCKTFDEKADGYVRGEGCGIIVLKRLSDAIDNGDRILAVIKGTAINQDGPSSGLTAPHGPAQREVITAALKNAGAKPADIGYVETHGTGTALGDPIEVQAIDAVLGAGRSPASPLFIGAVKTNIGHLEAAAGIASLIKTILVLEHQRIPPHLNMRTPNPFIPWDRLKVKVPLKPEPWPDKTPLLAGVSSFGFSGTNVHIILEGRDKENGGDSRHQEKENERTQHLLCLSAGSHQALVELAGQYRDLLAASPELSLADICFTANIGRAALPHRMTVLGDRCEGVAEHLDAFCQGKSVNGLSTAVVSDDDTPKIAFLFTGQGSQYVDMGRRLYETQPIFRKAMNRCDDLLKKEIDGSLLSIVYPQSGDAGEPGLIDQTYITQPALFAIEYALFELWRSWGIRPTAVMGHSVGEYVAACAAGMMDLEDGLRLIATRARLMQELPPGGAMAVIISDAAKVAEIIAGENSAVDIAAVNGPANVVISGPESEVERITAICSAKDIRSTPLKVSHAFHSSMVEPILDRFEEAASRITYNKPRLHAISNVTSKPFSVREAVDGAYWRRHVRQPVRFHDSMNELYRMGYRIFLEIGPQPVLNGMGRRCLEDNDIVWLHSLRRGGDDWKETLGSLGALYRNGLPVDWSGLDPDGSRRRVSLPTYPFQRKRYWVRLPKEIRRTLAPSDLAHPLLGRPIRSASQDFQYENIIRSDDFDFIEAHQVFGMTIMPAAAYVEMAAAAVRQIAPGAHLNLEDAFIREPLYFNGDAPCTIQTILSPMEEGRYNIQIFSLEEALADDASSESPRSDSWRLHYGATLLTKADDNIAADTPHPSIDGIRSRCHQEIDAAKHYETITGRGFGFGEALRKVSVVYKGDSEALGRVHAVNGVDEDAEVFIFSPAQLDSCLQFFWTLLPEDDSSGGYLPMSIESFSQSGLPHGELWSHISMRSGASLPKDTLIGDVSIYDASGKPVASIGGLTFRKIARDALLKRRGMAIQHWFYELQWEASQSGTDAIVEQLPAGRTKRYLTPPSEIDEFLNDRLAQHSAAEGLEAFHGLMMDIESLSTDYLVQSLRDLGWRPEKGALFTTSELGDELGILDKYRRLLNRLLQILAEEGVLQAEGTGWQVLNVPDPVDPAVALQKVLRHPRADEYAALELTNNCGRQLAKALQGRIDPLGLLFPDGSLSLAQRLYSESPEARIFNTLIRDAIGKAIEALPPDREIRILELGAGTGGATSFVLPGLPGERTKYVFTDLSPVFLSNAAERFKAYDFVDYKICDIERNAGEQGFEPESFDIVIAMNMIHATSDLRRSLGNARTFLSPGGMLILLEGTGPERWIDITFGLTDGWWAFKDTDLRVTCPLISKRQWRDILSATGFEDPTVVPENAALSKEAVVMAVRSEATAGEAMAGEKPWLILSDDTGVGAGLADQWADQGRRVALVFKGAGHERRSSGQWAIDPGHRSSYEVLFKDLIADGYAAFGGVVHLWSLDAQPPADQAPGGMVSAQMTGTGSLLYLLQAMGQAFDWTQQPKLYAATVGAQAADHRSAPGYCQSSLWGLGKVIALEHPDLNCRYIDMDPGAGLSDRVSQLFREIQVDDKETLVAYRDAQRLAMRLRRHRPAGVDIASRGGEQTTLQPKRLEKSANGILDDLALKKMERRDLEKGEVEILVHSIGLGFRDVMNALAMRADDDPLGSECSGKVIAVGDGVTSVEAGDEVIAVASGSFATHAVTPEHLVVKKPAAMTFESAATLPTVFLTAYYALCHIQHLSAGEHVLIHAAAGGVGMAAVQIALNAGAIVYGTAGSEEKRTYLRSIGVHHVFDSRSLDFADKIMEITGGRGVDAVLNSLADEFIEKSLSVLADGGRFMEIGKRDILTPEEAQQRRPDVAYYAIDLVTVTLEDPDLTRNLFQKVLSLAASGEIQTLPVTTFPLSRASEAFRFMSQARHTGKIVVINDLAPLEAFRKKVREDGTYVITGGLAGLGLLVAQRLAERGARHLALMGRSGAKEAAREVIGDLEKMGVQVMQLQADVSQRDQVREAFDTIEKNAPPVRGIIHSAGVLADGVIMKQTWERFETVMRPKIEGAWNLHECSSRLPLDFFILFSSTAGLFGSPGQSNHAAANAFLDMLAMHRHANGLPALSINWGVWSEIGAAAERKADKRVLSQGVESITPEQGLMALEQVMFNAHPHVAVVPINWPKFLPQYAGGSVPRWLSRMASEKAVTARAPAKTGARKQQTQPKILSRLKEAPVEKRWALLQTFLVDQTAKVLGLETGSQIDIQKPLNDQGLDSLMAVELRNVIAKGLDLGKGLAPTLIFDYPTIEEMTVYLAGEADIEIAADDASSAPDNSGGTDDLLDLVEGLSDQEVERLMKEKRGG